MKIQPNLLINFSTLTNSFSYNNYINLNNTSLLIIIHGEFGANFNIETYILRNELCKYLNITDEYS